MPLDPDAELVEAARGGDAKAFTRLIERCNGELRIFVAAHAANQDQLEEVCQATWVAAWQGLAGFRGEAPFAAWLRGVARNQLRREFVRQARARASSGLAELVEAVDTAVRTDLEEDAAERRLSRLPDCIGQLAPRARAMLLARDRDCVPLDALARHFKQPMGALATALWRIRLTMRSRLERTAP